MLRGALAVGAIGAVMRPLGFAGSRNANATSNGAFDFEEITAGSDVMHHVAKDYMAEILLRWGDPVVKEAPPDLPIPVGAPSRWGGRTSCGHPISLACDVAAKQLGRSISLSAPLLRV